MVTELNVAVLTAFLAGSIISNSLRDELPSRSHLRFRAFLAGTVIISTIAVVMRRLEVM